jgi:hypothetical protein
MSLANLLIEIYVEHYAVYDSFMYNQTVYCMFLGEYRNPKVCSRLPRLASSSVHCRAGWLALDWHLCM